MTTISTLDGLPKKFVNSLKVLFEILDEEKTGFVYLTDIEKRWSDNGTAGLPRGVLEALRKVTPENGRLSFERFVAGLKIALLRNKNDPPGPTGNGRTEVVTPRDANSREPYMRQSKSASDVGSVPSAGQSRYSSQNTATVRPNNVTQPDRSKTQSMPLLQNALRDQTSQNRQDSGQTSVPLSGIQSGPPGISLPDSVILGPLMPPLFRPERASWNPTASQARVLEENMQQDSISAALHKWQSERLDGQDRGLGDGRAANTAANQFGQSELPKVKDALGPNSNRRVTRRRSDVRRHTLSNGVDFNMIKRMKQLEQEKDVLLQGMEMVEQARHWYHGQVLAVQDKMKAIGKGSLQHDHSVEAYQERMNFQTARIQELNQQIKALLDSHEKGFPLHMNLAVSNTYQPHNQNSEPTESDNIIAMLKAQNKMLTKEVGQMQDKLAQLERDKSSLLRQVFEGRSKSKQPSHDDTTFI